MNELEAIKELFSHIKRLEFRLIKRDFKLFKQRRTRGFDDSETWSLDHTIAKFALPRLKVFKNLDKSHPEQFTHEQWKAVIDDMIYAMEYYDDLDKNIYDTKFDYDRIQKGCKLFGEHFGNLWS